MEKPNILLIMPDEMRGDCLSLEDHPVLQTPNMDAIGKGGVHFTAAYSTCTSCIAARRSLLTGQYPSTNGVVGYKEGVPITTPTVTQLLKDAGYSTAIAGRYMHQSPHDEPYGFETRVLGSTYVKNDDYAKYLDREVPDLGGIRGIGLSVNGREAKPWPVADEHHPTSWTVTQSRKLLAESDNERPRFLVTSFYSPHSPLFPPKRLFDEYLGKELPPAAVGDWEKAPPKKKYEHNVNASRVVLEGEELRRTQAGYYGLIAHIDEQVGALIAEFKARSEAEGRPWVLVFTADHGDMLGDHYLFRKCEPYEGSARIPFLVQGSKGLGFDAGSKCASPVCLEDIMPTLLELAGVKVPDNVDGKSLVSILRGGNESVRAILHGEHATCYDKEQAYHMLTDGHMKYIWRPGDGTEQLFDLRRDPGELRDLGGDGDEVVRWRKLLIEELKDRPEGFVKDGELVAGRKYGPVLPRAGKKGESDRSG